MNEKQSNAKNKKHNQTRQQQQERRDTSASTNTSSTGDIQKKLSSELTSKMSPKPLNGRQHVGQSDMDCTSTSSYSTHHYNHHHGNTDGHSLNYYHYPTPPAATLSYNKTAFSSSFNCSYPASYNPHQSYNHFIESDSRNSSIRIQQSSSDGTTIRRDHRTNLAQDPQEKHRNEGEYRRVYQNGCPSNSSQVPIAFYPSRGYDYQYQSHCDKKNNAKNYDYNTVLHSRRNVSPADPNTFNDDYDSNYKQSSHAEEKQVTSAAPSDTPKASNQKQKETKKTETQKKKKRKKPKDAPKRPLSAYNIFFKQERQRMLQSLPRMDNGPTSHSPSKSSRRRKGRDRPHGKISFENLAKTIGSRWRELGTTERKKFEILAAKDTERYIEEMKVFQDEQMLKASAISSNDHSHEDSDEKVSSSLKQRTTADYDSSAKNEVEKIKSGAAALEEREIEPVPFDSVFLPPSPFACEDDTNESWSLKDLSFDSLDQKKTG